MFKKSICNFVKSQKNILESKAFNWDSAKYCLVLSTGRTGTDFLADYLNNSKLGILGVHEPHPDLFDVGVAYRRGRISREETLNKLREVRVGLVSESVSKRAWYAETNNNLSLLTPILNDAFPSSKIVHLVRDPITWLRSSFSKYPSNVIGSPLFMSSEDLRKRLTAEDFSNDPYFGKWKEMTRFERLCWYWNKINSLIVEESKKAEVLTMKFESLFSEELGKDEISRFLKYLSIDSDGVTEGFESKQAKKRNTTVKAYLPEYKDWETSQKKVFDLHCGSLKTYFSY